MPSISQPEALSIINHYGSERKAATALGVSRASLRRLAGTLPTPKRMKSETIVQVGSVISKLPKTERKQIDQWESFFKHASPNMIRAFERQRNPKLKKLQKEFYDKLFKKWKKERNKPDSTISYHIWKAIMRKLYEDKSQGWLSE
ncbi:MAG TPA: hypothetical protein VGO47_14710 [Chlamydiales bacterium]|nr:hypothetical protein [Chlamydiales bacterium]